MKKKIIGIFVCLLLVSTIIIPVAAITKKHETRMASYTADVPIWEVGDEWTYHFNEFKTREIYLSLSGDLTLKVVDETGDSYILEATTRPQGGFEYENIKLKTTRLTFYTIRLQIRKSDLGLENYEERIKGIALLTIGSFRIPIPIQFEGHFNVEFDPTWKIIPFPLYNGKNGYLSSVEFWHTNVFLNMFWGLIPVLPASEESFPVTEVPYTCSQEQLTVKAGIFDVYNVTAEWFEGSKFVSYYSEEVGNIVKEVIYVRSGWGVNHALTLELKDWSKTHKGSNPTFN
jgi:hypothetical protein